MENLTVGLVGAGRISHVHARSWESLGAKLVIYSHEDGRSVAELYGATVVDSLEELLQRADVVDICTPTQAHLEPARAALEAGKDVICEKPMTRNAEDSRELIQLAAKMGRRIYPAHVVRYFQEYAAAKQAIDAGQLGNLAVLRFTRTGVFPEAPWFADEKASGGIIMDQMIHDIDQAVWMAGPVTKVFATSSRVENGAPIETAHVILTHESGTVSHCRGLWGAPGTAFAYTFHIAGTGGVLSFDSRHGTGFSLDEAASAALVADDGFLPKAAFVESPYLAQIREFAEAISGGQEPRVTAEDGLHAIELSLAAIESLSTGRAVDITNSTTSLAGAVA